MERTERTFVAVKPDGVARGLIGVCVARLEQAGLKIVGMKMLQPTPELVTALYPSDAAWFRTVGERSIKAFAELGKSAQEAFGTADPVQIGRTVKAWIVRFWTSGPIVALAVEGISAIAQVRRLVGDTDPLKAAPGSIRGDLSADAVINGNALGRPVSNVIHASGNAAEATNELRLIFRPEELLTYRRADEDYFYKSWRPPK